MGRLTDGDVIPRCDCEAWKQGIQELDDLIIFAYTHNISYTGGSFNHCPWCGKELSHRPMIKGTYGSYTEDEVRTRITRDHRIGKNNNNVVTCPICDGLGVLKKDGDKIRYVHKETEVMLYDLTRETEMIEIDVCFLSKGDR